MFLDYIDFRINLAIGFITMLVFISYFIQVDWSENKSYEECDDSEDPRKAYRWHRV
jgi:hypothetical protein